MNVELNTCMTGSVVKEGKRNVRSTVEMIRNQSESLVAINERVSAYLFGGESVNKPEPCGAPCLSDELDEITVMLESALKTIHVIADRLGM